MSHGMLQMDFPVDRWALAYPRVCRKLCLLAMIFKGGQSRKHCFLKMLENKMCFLFCWKTLHKEKGVQRFEETDEPSNCFGDNVSQFTQDLFLEMKK
jgi:hypothetical protein